MGAGKGPRGLLGLSQQSATNRVASDNADVFKSRAQSQSGKLAMQATPGRPSACFHDCLSTCPVCTVSSTSGCCCDPGELCRWGTAPPTVLLMLLLRVLTPTRPVGEQCVCSRTLGTSFKRHRVRPTGIPAPGDLPTFSHGAGTA